jgi:hypothetical protein
MPPVTPKQQRFMGAELAREREGKKTRTGMSEKQLEEYATKPKGGYKGKEKNASTRNSRR